MTQRHCPACGHKHGHTGLERDARGRPARLYWTSACACGCTDPRAWPTLSEYRDAQRPRPRVEDARP